MKDLGESMSEERALQNIEEAKVHNEIFKGLWEARTNTLSTRAYEFWKETPWLVEVDFSFSRVPVPLEGILEEAFGLDLTTSKKGCWRKTKRFIGFKAEDQLESFKLIFTSKRVISS